MGARAYHHGNLRSELIEQGLILLDAKSAQDVSLREIARRAGVSATAVYRHFPDRDALMTALAGRGLEALASAQHDAFEQAGGGTKGFSATGVAYVRFAQENPALFRLIFAQPRTDPEDTSQKEAMRFLQANAAALSPHETDPQVFALQAWSIAHGLALLILDGQIAGDDQIIRRVVDAHAMKSGSDEGLRK